MRKTSRTPPPKGRPAYLYMHEVCASTNRVTLKNQDQVICTLSCIRVKFVFFLVVKILFRSEACCHMMFTFYFLLAQSVGTRDSHHPSMGIRRDRLQTSSKVGVSATDDMQHAHAEQNIIRACCFFRRSISRLHHHFRFCFWRPPGGKMGGEEGGCPVFRPGQWYVARGDDFVLKGSMARQSRTHKGIHLGIYDVGITCYSTHVS